MIAISMIVEFKRKYKNTLIGKIGKYLLNKIRYVRFYFKLIFYRISPSSYYSQMKNRNNNSVSERQNWSATFNSHSNVEYELKRSFLWGNIGDKNELTYNLNPAIAHLDCISPVF